MLHSRGSGCQWRLDPMEEQPRNQEADPDDEAEQADEVDGGQFADALLPEFPEIGEHAERKERQDEEDDAKGIRLGDGERKLAREFCRRAESDSQTDRKGQNETKDEFRKALPNLDRPCPLTALRWIDVVRPDVSEDES